ncbi:dapper homolog 1 isoform X2 [Pelobates cultripes]|uniref:Dapper homolog 1 isoform X2 n=1 Tax=Pelobates cultripes TaxID=61616 RepID=A0AAD1TK46_PELCU|nr:dapper homolog 1 isoform X2 [Pelobates cultripes]
MESPRRKDKPGEADCERHRTRERLEATLAGLGELDYLRQRQEGLVRAALCAPPARDPGRSLEERILEDNILLLKKQLVRGVYRSILTLVIYLVLFSIHVDHSLTLRCLAERTGKPTIMSGSAASKTCCRSCYYDFFEWLDYRDGQSEVTGTIRRSLSTPHSTATDNVTDVNPKYQCDLVSKNGSDIYRYPSPLHAVAVQSPMFLLSVMGNIKEEREVGTNISDGCMIPELDSIKPEGLFPQQSSDCSVSAPSGRKMDGYILSIIQKKSHPVRTNKPRTSVNADPVKGILRHGSMCIKQTGAVSNSSISNPKNSIHSSAITSLDNGTCPPLKSCLKDSQSEQLEGKRMPSTLSCSPSSPNELQGQNSSRHNVKMVGQGLGKNPLSVTPSVLKELNSVLNTPTNTSNSACSGSLMESPHSSVPLPKEIKIVPPTKRISPKNTNSSCHSSSLDERPSLDFKSEGSSSQSLDEGLLVNAHYIPAQQEVIKLNKTTKNVKIVKSSTLKHRVHVHHLLENGSQTMKEKGKVVGKKCRFPDDLDTNKKTRKISPRSKKVVHSPGESATISKNAGGARSGNKPHGHAKDVVLAKPKHKRGDYRRWKSSAEISYEEALRRARRRNQRELVGVYAQVPIPYASPYTYIASDSEYSAECESLFHSTVVDTSEDEQSNYTTNCFGDSESSLSEVEFVGESTTSTSDTDESGGLIWSQFVHTLPMQSAATADLHTTAKAFVKIKASHNLKKKILRFRSGSLKLMTTV